MMGTHPYCANTGRGNPLYQIYGRTTSCWEVNYDYVSKEKEVFVGNAHGSLDLCAVRLAAAGY